MFSNSETVTQKETPGETTTNTPAADAAAKPSPVYPPQCIPWLDRVADPDPEFDPANPENQKRNCGHTGPISEAGKAKIAQNARKHGACSRTLILPGESEQEWRKLFSRWQSAYNAYNPDSLEYDFVVKTAQAEWYRLRVQLAYDDFQVCNPELFVNLNPDTMRRHDLLLRYKTTAERAFQREFRQLEQYCKSQKQTQKEQQKRAEAEQASQPPNFGVMPDLEFVNEETGESRIVPGVPAICAPLFPLNGPPNGRGRGH
jgi:hypothetical protein